MTTDQQPQPVDITPTEEYLRTPLDGLIDWAKGRIRHLVDAGREADADGARLLLTLGIRALHAEARVKELEAGNANLRQLLGLMYERWCRSSEGFDLNPAEVRAIEEAVK